MSVLPIDGSTPVVAHRHGEKAAKLAGLAAAGITIPQSVAVSAESVGRIVSGDTEIIKEILAGLDNNALLAVRSSSLQSEWGGVPALLNVGISTDRTRNLHEGTCQEIVGGLYCEFIQNYASLVDQLDSSIFDFPESHPGLKGAAELLDRYHEHTGSEFPQTVTDQLSGAIHALFRIWNEETARLLRLVQGAPDDAGIALVVQQMATCSHADMQPTCRSRMSRNREQENRLVISWRRQAVDFMDSDNGDEPGLPPSARKTLESWHDLLRRKHADTHEIDFIVADGTLMVLDYLVTQRTLPQEIRTAVELAEDGIISRADAVLRIDPKQLSRLLHQYAQPTGMETIIAQGIDASPGAAVGQVAFSSTKALEMAAKGIKCVLVRIETGPEDIRAMHTAQGVVTGRGGMTSHAAVIARGLGVPCVAGAMELSFDHQEGHLIGKNGITLSEGDIITVDGTNGSVSLGTVPLIKPRTDEFFERLLHWADHFRDIDIRANADSLEEASVAVGFGATGVGLCRTEHMFFDAGRLNVMREMIFTASEVRRSRILNDLLEMQKADFAELFRHLSGLPVCIRLFDPPLHEFLPGDQDEIFELARELSIPVEKIIERMDELREFNPMLGLRGVRLGIMNPEIYEMQARAIFEAVVEAGDGIDLSVPEIMIPLVSANREVEIVQELVETVADNVRERTGRNFRYSLGVMVETPRAALRAGDLARHASFLSFGTNDLTQLTYGISRDDAAKIIDEYIRRGVYALDPFNTLDIEGTGELLSLATERSRACKDDIVLSICGEHSADPATIQFCRENEFSYVSCAPYSVPIARLAAAQSAIRQSRPGAKSTG